MIGAMAWRIEDSVIRGEIDNTEEGHTSGKIWLAGRKKPITLRLEGNCLRDLAGCRLSFSNPFPAENKELSALADEHAGRVGDMTASRRCRVPKHPDEDYDPIKSEYVWKNLLYIEWFSEFNGRVLIEAEDFDLSVSEPAWQMDEDAETGQEMANLHEMREFVRQIVDRRESASEEEEEPETLDEFQWEERLKESDRLTDAYQEVIEKYMDDPHSEQKEAFAMGWDGLLDAMASNVEENEDEEEFDTASQPESDPEFLQEFEPHQKKNHPLQDKAQELALRAMDLIERDSKTESVAHSLLSNLLQVTGKLAGALNGWDDDYRPEPGFVLAILKRCLHWLNEAVSECQELIAVEEDPVAKESLIGIRASIFEIRDGVTDLRREMKS